MLALHYRIHGIGARGLAFASVLPHFALALTTSVFLLSDFAFTLPDFAFAFTAFAFVLPDLGFALTDFAAVAFEVERVRARFIRCNGEGIQVCFGHENSKSWVSLRLYIERARRIVVTNTRSKFGQTPTTDCGGLSQRHGKITVCRNFTFSLTAFAFAKADFAAFAFEVERGLDSLRACACEGMQISF